MESCTCRRLLSSTYLGWIPLSGPTLHSHVTVSRDGWEGFMLTKRTCLRIRWHWGETASLSRVQKWFGIVSQTSVNKWDALGGM